MVTGRSVRRALTTALAIIGVSATAIAGTAFWALRQTYPSMPALTGRLVPGTLQHGGIARSWLAYVPPNKESHPALVVVLHSSMGTAQEARAMFGYDFDVMADRHGFVVAYPNGVGGYWNEAKVQGAFQSKLEKVDDVGFLNALVDALVQRYDIACSRIYVTGVSNGGSMVLRLALEVPDFARAYAVVGASLPAPGNLSAAPSHQAVSILLMNGTDDPVNPWSGGDVVLRGLLTNRGPVLSTRASIDYFRTLAGVADKPTITRLPDRDASDGSTVARLEWRTATARIVLYEVIGGGHQVPHPATYGRRLLGHSNRDIHAAHEMWNFFRAVESAEGKP